MPFVWFWCLQKLQKVNYTVPAHLFAKNAAANTLILMKFYIKCAWKIQVWLKLKKIYHALCMKT